MKKSVWNNEIEQVEHDYKPLKNFWEQNKL